jgi:osmotically-inducible protein OsmY
MKKFKTISATGLAFIFVFGIFASGLSGCAIFPKCSPEYCATDKKINTDVSQLLSEHPEFGAPADLHIQVINGVVYLSGPVDSDFEVRRAEALVRQVANVKDVENNLYPRSNSR